MDDQHIALQLYTVRDQTAQDFTGTLESVARIGYKAVEFAGYGTFSPEELRDTMQRVGLSMASAHVNWNGLLNNFENELKFCTVVGSPYLVLSSLPQPMRAPEALPEVTRQMKQAARRCADAGVRFGYHNHDPEFAMIDGKTWLDRMLDETQEENVALELDVYWAAFAKVDPLQLIQRLGSRLQLLHVKDMATDGTYTEVGSGTLDWPTLLHAAGDAGCAWYIVEHDKPTKPSLESAEQSLRYLQGLQIG